MSKPSIVAHRGGAALRPENTMAAFIKAVQLGADEIECDVHRMKDGKVVVFHDFALQQLTGRPGLIEHIDERERQQLRIGSSDQPPPLLEELAQLLANTSVRLHLEIKEQGRPAHETLLANKALAILQHHQLLDRTSAISFNPACLSPFVEAGVPAGPCIDNPAAILPQDFKAQTAHWKSRGYRYLSLNAAQTPEDFLHRVVDEGFTVGVWTVNGPARLAYWLRQPVHYITTDQPDLALQMRDGG